MRRQIMGIGLAAVAAASALAPAARAASVMDREAFNGITVFATATASYQGAGSADNAPLREAFPPGALAGSVSGDSAEGMTIRSVAEISALPAPAPVFPPPAPGTPDPTVTPFLPASGDGTISGTVDARFRFGDAATVDTFSVFFDAMASAGAAMTSAGEAADAVATLDARFEFFLSAPSTPAGLQVGAFELDPIVADGPYDTVVVRLTEFAGATPTVFETATGGAGLSVPLISQRGYAIDYLFSYTIPHGVDPSISTELTATITPSLAAVPLPPAWLLLSLGIAALRIPGSRRRR